jgi:hypothetical protein
MSSVNIANSSAVSFNGANVGKAYFGSSVVFRDRNMMNNVSVTAYYHNRTSLYEHVTKKEPYHMETGATFANSNSYPIMVFYWTDSSASSPMSYSTVATQTVSSFSIPANSSVERANLGGTTDDPWADPCITASTYYHFSLGFADETWDPHRADFYYALFQWSHTNGSHSSSINWLGNQKNIDPVLTSFSHGEESTAGGDMLQSLTALVYNGTADSVYVYMGYSAYDLYYYAGTLASGATSRMGFNIKTDDIVIPSTGNLYVRFISSSTYGFTSGIVSIAY